MRILIKKKLRGFYYVFETFPYNKNIIFVVCFLRTSFGFTDEYTYLSVAMNIMQTNSSSSVASMISLYHRHSFGFWCILFFCFSVMFLQFFCDGKGKKKKKKKNDFSVEKLFIFDENFPYIVRVFPTLFSICFFLLVTTAAVLFCTDFVHPQFQVTCCLAS